MTGSLQIKRGKYYAVINTYVDGKRTPTWVSTGYDVKGNKKRAEKALQEAIRDFEEKTKNAKNTNNRKALNTDCSVVNYIENWLKTHKLKVAASTYQGYKCILDAHIIPYFKEKNISLSDLTRNDIQDYINFKYEDGRNDGKGGLSAKSVKSHIIIIRQALEEAITDGLIKENPCSRITLPQIQPYNAKFYSKDQIETLLKLTKDDVLYPLIYFTAMLGLRRSEALGLRWSSINYDLNKIFIEHTVVRVTETVAEDKTKNAASHRSYPLLDEFKTLLKELKEKEDKNRILFGSAYEENDYIFKWDDGKPFTPDYVSSHFHDLITNNHLPKIRFHDLRHSCASILIALGYSLKDVQDWLGHSDITVTANTYAHLDSQRKNETAKSIVNSFSL